MSTPPDILCIGSVLWDIIGRSDVPMRAGSDVPGRITQIPGGVALNVAMALARFGLKPALLSAVGYDVEGRALMEACGARGLLTEHILRTEDLPTDTYMAVEGANGLIAAIADAHSLEKAGDRILRPLTDGSLPAPYTGAVVLDGNLTLELLTQIAQDDLLAAADLRVAPASPGKALRLRPFVQAGRGTLYVNLEEAGLLCDTTFTGSAEAAGALLQHGAHRVVVTHGDSPATAGTQEAFITQNAPPVQAVRITGAGDTFMAAHIAAERAGHGPQDALSQALDAAALYVSGATTI